MASIHVAILALSIHEQNFQSDVALSALGAFQNKKVDPFEFFNQMYRNTKICATNSVRHTIKQPFLMA